MSARGLAAHRSDRPPSRPSRGRLRRILGDSPMRGQRGTVEENRIPRLEIGRGYARTSRMRDGESGPVCAPAQPSRRGSEGGVHDRRRDRRSAGALLVLALGNRAFADANAVAHAHSGCRGRTAARASSMLSSPPLQDDAIVIWPSQGEAVRGRRDREARGRTVNGRHQEKPVLKSVEGATSARLCRHHRTMGSKPPRSRWEGRGRRDPHTEVLKETGGKVALASRSRVDRPPASTGRQLVECTLPTSSWSVVHSDEVAERPD
jgi:hypothetical protein